MTQGTAVARTPQPALAVLGTKKAIDFRETLHGFTPELARIASKRIPAETIIDAALHAAVGDAKLFECTPASVFLALSKVARWQLHLGDGVFLVPFNKNVGSRDKPEWVKVAEAVPSYQGLKALAMRQRMIRMMDEYTVFKGDRYSYTLGLQPRLEHQPCYYLDRGPIVEAYSIITLIGGAKTFHRMPIEDINAIRAKSQSWGPDRVKDCPTWYAKKTVVRDWLSKQPKEGALAEAYNSDDTTFEAESEDSTRPAFQVPQAGEFTPEPAPPTAPTAAIAPARRAEVKLATPNQRSLLRNLMKSSVWTDAERAECDEYLADDNLTWEAVGEKLDLVHQNIADRKATRRAAEDLSEFTA